MHQAPWHWALLGRRRHIRRRDDHGDGSGRHGSDWYPTRLLPVALGIFILSGVDAALTLWMLRTARVVEVNPLLGRLIELDERVFLNLKLVVTGVILFALVPFWRYRLGRLGRVEHLLRGVLWLYTILVAYELVLAFRFVLTH